MGFNTALMICNDGMDELRRDPLAAEKLHQGILLAGRQRDGWGFSVSIGNHCNPVSILPSEHADYAQLVIVGGNSIRRIATLGGSRARFDWDAEGVFATLADQLGYNVSKKAWRKRQDAQGIEAASAGETQSGSTEGESAVLAEDAP